MNTVKCLICGSSNLRADRSLSGRLVCNLCGTPYGVRKGIQGPANFNYFIFKKKYLIFLIILILSFILIII